MALSSDPMTRSTRRAANAAAFAVVAAAVLWAVTTQVAEIRAISPFGDDPWDAVATDAAIFLSLIAGPTWIRSLRHRAAVLPARTARRIRWGVGLAAGIVLAMAGADSQAIAANGFPAGAGPRAIVIAALVALALVTSIVAVLLVVRAASIAAPDREADAPREPDIVEDLLALAADVSAPVGLRGPVERFGVALESFLERSRWSPRRHRATFGLVASIAIGVAYAGWHVLREGPPPTSGVLLLYVVLMASTVLGAYLGMVVPLRLLRPPAS